jgi:L-asparagine transporter-like permease
MKSRSLTYLVIAIVIFIIKGCLDNTSQNNVSAAFPQEAEDAFNEYLRVYANGIADSIVPSPSRDTSRLYIATWASKVSTWRKDIVAAWCIFTTGLIQMKSGDIKYEFLVYQMAKGGWLVTSAQPSFESLGCR